MNLVPFPRLHFFLKCFAPLTSRDDQCGNLIGTKFCEVFSGTCCPLPSSLSISCPTVDRAVKDVLKCLPLAVFTVKQVTKQSEYVSQVLVVSRLHKCMSLWRFGYQCGERSGLQRVLTRTMTSNLLGRLGSCVLSVLSGKGPHAAHWKLPWE